MAAALKIIKGLQERENEVTQAELFASAVESSPGVEVKTTCTMQSSGYVAGFWKAGKVFGVVPVSVNMGPSVQIENDFHGWLLDQAAALRGRNNFALDYDALAEELEAMAKREQREGKKHLKNML